MGQQERCFDVYIVWDLTASTYGWNFQGAEIMHEMCKRYCGEGEVARAYESDDQRSSDYVQPRA